MSEPLIQLLGINKSFGERMIYRDLNLDVHPGETLVIMGGSGSGKSTLLRVLMGHLNIDSGQILIRGRALEDMNRGELDAWRKSVGVLFQSGALFNSMTLRENLALPVREHTDLDDETIDLMAQIYLQLVGLREHIDKLPAELSGGMKKRGGLARALMMQPRILFYDEPTAGLDPVSTAQIDELIMNLKNKMGATSVVVTHDMQSAFKLADRLALLFDGKFAAVGTVEEFRTTTNPLVRQFVDGRLVGPFVNPSDQCSYKAELLGRKIQEVPHGKKTT
jgi:phospholipid/cholesterol/gamma-HCH transport system ATP-binding protein